jgi:threonine synthase
VARGTVRASDRVVVVSTANGLKFTDFKVRYHEGTLPSVPEPRHANRPVEVPDDYAAVRGAVLRSLD